MLALGLRDDVVLVNAHGQFLEQLPEGVNLVKLNAGRAFNSIVPLVHYFRMAYPDVVLSALTHINLSVIIAQKLSGFCVRLVVSEHNNLSERTSHAKKLFDKLAHIVARLFYPFSDSIVCVSKDSATDLIKRTGLAENKVTVVYNRWMKCDNYPRRILAILGLNLTNLRLSWQLVVFLNKRITRFY
jgi:hypothetical protein